ncbi:hypothetical protein BS47DRAFT_1138552 [Hydnum rufescens UP504]|uniref:Uncharacterized protein n=1 Tax=Hydnum rufescens UP504 TaxID=1448309 RepID=A0A9P6DS35_9AGAM|nr:hypothetical protein BS47DRAFT_1138552 [Hydnum rufescens UP504]
MLSFHLYLYEISCRKNLRHVKGNSYRDPATTRRIWTMEVSQLPKHAYIIYDCLHYCTGRVNERLTLSLPRLASVNLFQRPDMDRTTCALREITAHGDAKGLGLEDLFPVSEQDYTGAKVQLRTEA